jgi:citrate lyase subunit beta/citryl-CoA lyase
MTSWRSLLFVPGDNKDLLAKAATRDADAIIIDLEDAVAATAKQNARDRLPEAVTKLADNGSNVVVRINAAWREAYLDLDAAVRGGVAAIMAPKVESVHRLNTLSEIIGEFEQARDLPPNGIGLIALIESPAGIANLSKIATIERVIGLAFGSEDFCLELGAPPSRDSLALPCQLVALAAASRKLMALATPISITVYRAEGEYHAAVVLARATGATGAICIHPIQVRIANDVFGLGETDRAEARAILAAWETATREGRAVTTYEGRMIDRPVAERARRLLSIE